MFRTCIAFVLAGLGAWGEAPARQTLPGWRFDQNIAYGDQSAAQRLDILHPGSGGKPMPAVIHIHGGGWQLGNRGGDSVFALMSRLAEKGMVAIDIDYRLSDEAKFPAAIEDCKLAVRWLRAHAAEYGIDPERIGAIGASAGGHLSALLAVTGEAAELAGTGGHAEFSSAIQAAVPVCAPLDLRTPLCAKFGLDDPLVAAFLGGTPAAQPEAARQASPQAYVRAALPPMLFIHGTADNRVEVRHSQEMVAALRAAGAPCELQLVAGGKHGMGIAREEPMQTKIVEFFVRNLKPAKPNAAALERWRDAKFGLFVHWGVASLRGKELSWSRGGERPGLPDLPPGDIPREEYDALYAQFNPDKFDARAWVSAAKDAGMKYLTFTTKHHDGFSLFDSQLTDYDIMASPYGKDLAAQLAEACHEGGLGLHWYYSLPDWHHPDYLTERHDEYKTYYQGQVRELLSHYGKVDAMWFDGKGKGSPDRWNSPQAEAMIRSLQPEILINDRIWGDTDFYTPEQVIGRFDPVRPWESCVTLGDQWGWKPEDRIKSWQECVALLCRAVGGGGNLVLNVGPMPTGEIEPRQVAVLMEIGEWINRHGEAIFGTRGGPFPPSYWGASAHRGDTIYLYVMPGWEASLRLAPLAYDISGAKIFGGEAVSYIQEVDGITVDIPEGQRTLPVSIVELTLNGPTADLAAAASGLGVPEGATATVPNVRRNEERYGAAAAIDEDPMSRWATDDGVTESWIEMVFPEPATFDVVLIDEAFGPRVEAFRILAKEGETWKEILAGAGIGRNWAGRVPKTTTSAVRLEITKASDGPTFRDIRFHFVKE